MLAKTRNRIIQIKQGTLESLPKTDDDEWSYKFYHEGSYIGLITRHERYWVATPINDALPVVCASRVHAIDTLMAYARRVG